MYSGCYVLKYMDILDYLYLLEPRSRTIPWMPNPCDRSHVIPRRRTDTHENATTVAKAIMLLRFIVPDWRGRRYIHTCRPDLIRIETRALDVGIPRVLQEYNHQLYGDVNGYEHLLPSRSSQALCPSSRYRRPLLRTGWEPRPCC